MSRQIELALTSLIPTYGQDLPPSLVDLAGSLLAQSRHKASTLKADEEVARGYACANLACDRLKISLDLPTIQPRPPVPPRIYKKLYAHLDNILPDTSSNRRASGRVRATVSKFGTEDSPARAIPSRGTPTKDQSLAQFRTKSTPGKSRRFESTPSKGVLRPWIAPVARFLCHEADHKRLSPTIIAGMEHVIQQSAQTRGDWVEGHMTDLLVAIYFFCMMRVTALTTVEVDAKESYMSLRKQILELLPRARAEVTFSGAEDEAAWLGWSLLRVKNFDEAIAYAREQDWFDSDWFEGIASVVKSSQDADADMVDADNLDGLDEPGSRADTMFQEKYDYLNETRRADYKVWKETQLARIAELSAANGAMEIDAH